jgi:hypothetical protein
MSEDSGRLQKYSLLTIWLNRKGFGIGLSIFALNSAILISAMPNGVIEIEPNCGKFGSIMPASIAL